MEHRYSKRSATNIKVLIYTSGLPTAIGRLSNIGRHGLFVQCQLPSVAINQPLEVELLMHVKPASGHFRYKCYLMHKSHDGLGLAVHEESIPTYSAHADTIVAHSNRSVTFDVSLQTTTDVNNLDVRGNETKSRFL